ncbi:MAG TPA: TolC family protein [Acidobacteriota bacterium]
MKTAGRIAFISLALSVGAVSFAQTGGGGTLTVAEAVTQVLQHNNSLREAEDAIAVITAKVGQSRSGLFPAVFAELAYARLGPTSEFALPGLGTFQLFPFDNYDAHVGAHYMVYDSKRTARTIELAGSQVASAVDRKEMVRRDLEFQTGQLFYAIIFLQDQSRIQDEHIHMLEEHLETTRRRLASGTATELDVLNTQSRLVSAQNQKLELENSLEKQSIMLKRLLGRRGDEPLELIGELSYQPGGPAPEELIAAALQRRVEARAIRSLLETNAIQYKLAGLRDKPAVTLNASAGVKNGYIPDLNKPILNFVLALNADIPIFDGHLTRYQKAEVAASAKGLDHRGQEVAEMIRADVLQALADVRTSEKELQLVAIPIQQSKKALEFATARYEAGTVTQLDVIDAIEACSLTQLMQLQALYKCVVSTLNLRRASGAAIIVIE